MINITGIKYLSGWLSYQNEICGVTIPDECNFTIIGTGNEEFSHEEIKELATKAVEKWNSTKEYTSYIFGSQKSDYYH